MKQHLISRGFKFVWHAGYKTFRFIVPSANTKILRTIKKIALEVDALDAQYANLTDEQLQSKTQEFKDMLAQGKTLDDILVPAFATVREAAFRIRGEKPYLVQIIGGIVLHRGMVAEMGTGEGKTLVATMPAYLNALAGKGVHIITVNDYLAKRDSQAMTGLFNFLQLRVDCIVHGMQQMQKKYAYNADITYGTNHEFVFDYLRDNMAKSVNEIVQRPYFFSICDEIDNILIDEARTPCIISGEAVESSQLCVFADYIVKQLQEGDYETEEKSRNAYFTEQGLENLENILRKEGVLVANETLFDEQYVLLVHHLNQSLKAVKMYNEGIQYIVKNGEILIVDEFTGRIMDGRRYSDGLHQALEAKEGVEVQKENQTLATITYQKFFELYPKKSGMTGTAATEAEEFAAIYKLNVVSIPPNKPSRKMLLDDKIYRTFQEKLESIVQIVQECQAKKQPILIGTVSVEKSEIFSHALKAKGIEHQVLNAKNHANEANIIAQAGAPGAVTIATNMAGRGTDIKLGGNLEHILNDLQDIDQELYLSLKEKIDMQAAIVRDAGGLFVLGTERHESRRIDNQLVGRCGRQGDKGTALFVVSIEDSLMQIFGGGALARWLPKMKYGEVIEHPLVTRAMNKAQKRVEEYHFDMRKNVLRYDAIINDQSKMIYKERYEFMTNEHVFHLVKSLMGMCIDDTVNHYIQTKESAALLASCKKLFNIEISAEQMQTWIDQNKLASEMMALVDHQLDHQVMLLGDVYLEYIAKDVCLSTLDLLWRQHLTKIENLRQGINLRSYGQKDPLNEFKREAFVAFEEMLLNFRHTVVSCIFHHKNMEEQKTVE